MARSLLIEAGNSLPEASVLSVTPEAAANAAFQAAPQWSTRTDQVPANDIFGALVNESAANSPAPPAQLPRRADENAPPANNTGSTPYDAANQPANNDPNNNAGAGPPSNANASAGSNANSGSASSASTQPSATTSDPSKSGSSKPADKRNSEDTSSADATILAQQAGLTATTPIPVAVAIPLANQPTNVPSATPSAGASTAPLAIAAAAIAASSQPLAGPPGTPAPVKTDPTASPATTTKAAPPPQTTAGVAAAVQQATPANAPPASTIALTNAVAATAPVTAKAAPAKSSAATAATDGATTTSGTTDPSATSAPVGAAQNALLQQTSTAGKPEAGNVAVDGSTGDSTTSSAPAISAREHSQAANAAHTLADAPDGGTQAAGTFQTHLNSTTSPTPSGALTVTAATNGPVPLNGLALEIAASVKSGKSRFEIRLDPADLGRIDVRIDIDRNGQVTSHLTVEKPETLSLLRQDAPQLQRALDDAGLKTGSGGLQFSLRDQSSSGQNGGNDPGSNSQRLIISEEDATTAAVAGRTYGRWLGSSGGVDIRV
jgi:flagellar hook-length control protein FliK